jgi:hypothetical protein
MQRNITAPARPPRLTGRSFLISLDDRDLPHYSCGDDDELDAGELDQAIKLATAA